MNKILVKPYLIGHVIITKNMQHAKQAVLVYRKEHPFVYMTVNIPANLTFQQMKPSLSPETLDKQKNAGFAWEATNWNGACDDLAKIAKPTLVIAGTDDNFYNPHANALVIASKVPGAWLVQIKDAGHAVVDQYPDEVGKIVQTFLSTIK
jgi:pimeloyl-ACP methyl ester carboxylesterase